MSSVSKSLTAAISLATAIAGVVLSVPAIGQTQTTTGTTNSGGVAAPLGSIITTTPNGTTIVTPAPNTGTVNSGSGTTSTGTTGVTGGTPTTGVTVGTPATGVTNGTPTTGVTLPSTGTAPASTTPVGGATSR